MENVIIGGIISFFTTFYAVPVIITVANRKKLYDLPDERKIHSSPIPSLGGVGIFIGFMLGLLLTATITSVTNTFQYYFAAFLVVFFFGLKDDIFVLSPMKKFIGQIIVTAILMFKANLLITDMHGFWGITIINPAFSYFLTMFTIIVVMNAYNLIDGVDGLASTIGIITSSVLGVFFFMNGDTFFATLGFTFAASLAGFLIYNFSPAKIFMGDTGSMLSGVVNAILVIRFIETAESSHILPVLATPAMGFGILMIPLLDTLRVFGIRIIHGRSPFSPDRNHLHHILLDRGLCHKTITYTLALSVILFIVLTYFALPLGTTKVILAQIVIFFIGIYLLQITKRKTKKLQAVKDDEFEEFDFGKKVRRLVTFTKEAEAVNDEK